MAVADPSLLTAISRLSARGTSVVPMIYDGSAFDSRRRVQSATSPEFAGALRDAGAVPAVMPTEVSHA